MKNYISVNIVPQALLLLLAMEEHSCDTPEKVAQLKTVYGVNKRTALSFARQCHWISDSDSRIIITIRGNQILSRFTGSIINQALWRMILSDYIAACHPIWARRIPYGRKEAYIIMNEEEQRCFDEAGLMDSVSTDVIDWWDSLAKIEREKKNMLKEEIGRKGELFTMRFEKERTGINPYWSAVESNLAGYDILSVRSHENREQILIEVKTTMQSIEVASCSITRHEWDTATRHNNAERYFFYLWCIGTAGNNLAIIDVKDMAEQIPSDMNQGKWENATVPYSVFIGRFSSVACNFPE